MMEDGANEFVASVRRAMSAALQKAAQKAVDELFDAGAVTLRMGQPRMLVETDLATQRPKVLVIWEAKMDVAGQDELLKAKAELKEYRAATEKLKEILAEAHETLEA